jgi:hypothetical protein
MQIREVDAGFMSLEQIQDNIKIALQEEEFGKLKLINVGK